MQLPVFLNWTWYIYIYIFIFLAITISRLSFGFVYKILIDDVHVILFFYSIRRMVEYCYNTTARVCCTIVFYFRFFLCVGLKFTRKIILYIPIAYYYFVKYNNNQWLKPVIVSVYSYITIYFYKRIIVSKRILFRGYFVF